MTRRGAGHGRAVREDGRAVDARERVDVGAVRRGIRVPPRVESANLLAWSRTLVVARA